MDIIRKIIRKYLREEFNVIGNTLKLNPPYDNIKKTKVGGRDLYILFGDVDYYPNKQSILALKRKSSEIELDYNNYEQFLKEFKRRFDGIEVLRSSDLLVSVETTCPITDEIGNFMDIPYIKNGFGKIDPSFKMRDLNDFEDRKKISNLFKMNFSVGDNKTICVIDDFVTSGSTFKNAFDMLPLDINVVGVCLFQLKS